MKTPRIVATADPPEQERPIYRARVNKPLKRLAALAAAAAVSGCEIPEPDRAEREAWEANQAAAPAPPQPAPRAAEPEPGPLEPDPPGTRWETAASGEGASLILITPEGERRLTLFCRPRSGELVLNVPRFRPVGSEERLSFGAGRRVVALVADPAGDAQRGGVSALAPLTEELSAMLLALEPFSLSYGSQTSGPHREMMPEIARGFIAACGPSAG